MPTNSTPQPEGIAPIELSFACPKDWDGMSGDESKRFCELCQKDVHNLSAMTESEATAFIDTANAANMGVCITYELTDEGVLKTRPESTSHTESTNVIWLSRLLSHTASAPLPWVAAFLILALAFSPVSWGESSNKPAPCKVNTSEPTVNRTVGEMLYTPPTDKTTTPTTTTQSDPKPTRTLGKIKPPPKPKPPSDTIRGRMVPSPPKKKN